jgi:hypothetical protein
MPCGPRGEKRPADAIGNAVKIMRIATGEETEELKTDPAAAELGSRGGKARAAFNGGRRQANRIPRGFAIGCATRRLRVDRLWNGGWTLDRHNIVGIRLSDYAASQRRPGALRFSGTTGN